MAIERMQKLAELGQKADPITESATGGASAAAETFVNSAFDGEQGDGGARIVRGNDVDFGLLGNTDNIFAAAAASDSSSSVLSNYESQLNSALKSAERYQKTMMILSGINAGANLLNSAVDTVAGTPAVGGSGNFFSNIGKLFGSSKTAPTATTPATSTVTGTPLTSDLTTAISNYSSKGNSENWTALNNEIEKAKNDKATLAQIVADNDAIVKEFNQQKPQLEQAIKDAKAEVNAAQKAVDDNKIGVQAEIRVNAIPKEIQEQEGVITASKQKVSDGSKAFNDTKTDQNAIISKNEPDLQATKTITITSYNNGTPVQTKQEVPDEEKRQAAKKAIEDAKKAIEKAENDFKDILKNEIGSETEGAEPTESSVQGKAKAKIDALNKEKEEKQKIVEANGGKDKVEALIKARQDAGTKLETAEQNLKDATDKKNAAVTKSSQASVQIKTLDRQISEAEKLMSKKQK